jgi:hypothetical protein
LLAHLRADVVAYSAKVEPARKNSVISAQLQAGAVG